MDKCMEEMLPQTRVAVACAVHLLASAKSNCVTPLTFNPNVFAIDSTNLWESSYISVNDLINVQLHDPVTSRVIQFVEKGKRPLAKDLLDDSSDVKRLLRDWPKLVVQDNLLKRNVGTISQIVLPQKYHHLASKALHEDMGHLGTERVFDL